MAGARSKSQAKVPAARDVELGKGMRLRLPALTIGRPRVELASFDLWVQRGWLLAEFRPDPGFLRIPIHLGKALSQTEQERLVATSGFAVPAKKRLTYAYALPEGADGERHLQDEDEGDEGGNWRRKFFVWTQLGEWCSQACHEAEHAHFYRKGLEKRQARLFTLKTLRTASIRERERSLFIASLSTLWQQLGDDASALLRGADSIDMAYYGQQFDQRVERDLALVDDREFRKRYLSGYEVSQVPRFRPDVRGWSDFVGSLVRQICLDGARRNSQARLPRAVLEAAESIECDDDLFDKPGELLALLREIFEGGQRGDPAMAEAAKIIGRYHRD